MTRHARRAIGRRGGSPAWRSRSRSSPPPWPWPGCGSCSPPSSARGSRRRSSTRSRRSCGPGPRARARRRRSGGGSAVLAAGALAAAGWLLGGVTIAVIAAVSGPMIATALVTARRRRFRVRARRERARRRTGARGRAVRRALDPRRARHVDHPGPGRARAGQGRPRGARLGANTQTVLERLRRKASSPAWDSIVAGVLLQRDAGGDLPNLLRDLAVALETATRQEREAIAATAQARFTARIVLGLPLVAALLAELAKPGPARDAGHEPGVAAADDVRADVPARRAGRDGPDHAERHPVTRRPRVPRRRAARRSPSRTWRRAAAHAPRVSGLIARLGARTNLKATTGLAGRIQAAGLDRATHEIVALQAGLAILTTLTALPLVTAAPGRLGLALLLAAPVTGFALPELGLKRRTDHRRRQIEAELPDVLDLLRVAIAAGLAPRRALAEVGRRHPGTLARELTRFAARTQLGEPVDARPRPPAAAVPVPHHPTVRRRPPPRRAPRHPTSAHAPRPSGRSALPTGRPPQRTGRQSGAEDPARRRADARSGRAAADRRGARAVTRHLARFSSHSAPRGAPQRPPKRNIRVQIARLHSAVQIWHESSHRRKALQNAAFSDSASPKSGSLCGFRVAEWGEVGYFEFAKPLPGGGAPPTPPPGID